MLAGDRVMDVTRARLSPSLAIGDGVLLANGALSVALDPHVSPDCKGADERGVDAVARSTRRKPVMTRPIQQWTVLPHGKLVPIEENRRQVLRGLAGSLT